MSILEGALAQDFYNAFSPIYSDATLTRVSRVDDGEGGWADSTTTQAVKAQRDDLSEAMRAAAGYTDREVRILVLRHGVGEMNTDCRITLYGVEYLVSFARSDSAGAYWECRCRKR